MATAFARAFAQESVCDTRDERSAASAISLTAPVGVCLLIAAMPFESVTPLISVPAQSLSTTEAVLLGVLATWLIALARCGVWPPWRTPLTAPWGLWVAVSVLAAIAAPAYQANAISMSARLALAFAVLLLTVHGATSWTRIAAVSLTAVLVGALVGVIVIADYLAVGVVRHWLAAFRPAVTVVGAQVRASGPFQYPTIASMYLEILFALALPVFALAIQHRRRARAATAALALLLLAQANALTFTRAGLVTMVASLGIVAWCRSRTHGVDALVGWLALFAAIVGAQFLGSRSIESVALRLTTEGQDAWYETWIDAPARVDLPTSSVGTVALTLTNTGRVTWDSRLPQPFRVSYHWLTPDGQQVVSWEGRRTLFPQPVPPGGRVTLPVQVMAPPQPGEYRLMWDIEQEHRLWFSTEPDAPRFLSTAHVSGPPRGALGPLAPLPRPLQHGSVRPRRVTLWQGAARMIADRPWFGVGPDNYRLQYGSYLGLAGADTRIHSNNMYLEVLAGTGLLGATAFALLIWRARAASMRTLRRLRAAVPTGAAPPAMAAEASMLAAGIAAAAAAIAIHGLVDSFLSFTATYVLMAITLGLLVAGESLTRSHANRV